ncbi:hypothetical protein J0944_001162 [Salmonella enterica subsp. enterica serovar Enteritidis]|nr:hypothetical protein [Salmonella enterica subsp. enterica serovar Enteritidis]EHF2785305.1 hypothetical protein [Salmonella enterica subsp. enterica serovar Enteritidis]EIA9365336.1 hypothetical protein [Salmonella enterica]HDP0188252.1 hypothetical protein [Salmonella enterica subsp. enterica serovar Concord]
MAGFDPLRIHQPFSVLFVKTRAGPEQGTGLDVLILSGILIAESNNVKKR